MTTLGGANLTYDGRDLQTLERLYRLHPALISDCLDRIDIRDNAMAPHIRPLYPEAKIAGYAVTVEIVEVHAPPANRDDWYRGELQAVDSLREGDVMVVSTCRSSYWGELLATASRYRGARGIVADTYTRDTLALIEMRFPTFAAGISVADSLGRIDVAQVNVPIECGGVLVNPGDLILADYDGIVVIPQEGANDVITAAEEKLARENIVRDKLAEGMPTWEAFRTYGVI